MSLYVYMSLCQAVLNEYKVERFWCLPHKKVRCLFKKAPFLFLKGRYFFEKALALFRRCPRLFEGVSGALEHKPVKSDEELKMYSPTHFLV